MAEVKLVDLTKKFDGVIAVDKINVDIQDREFLVLLGPSGCGKSTTLRMIAGLEEVSSGDIYIGDKNVNDKHPKDRDIAMVFQNYALYPHMNVYQNMSFGLENRRTSKPEIDRLVREAARILDIENLLERKPKELSGGQRQRVAMGRAIVRNPKAFLFDEPLSNLDAKLRMVMRGELIKLHKKLKTTIVYVTHDQVEAMTLADRIVVMKDGRIMQIGEPMEIYHQPNSMFVAGFLGSPPINFIDVHVVKENETLYLQQGRMKLKIPEERKPRYDRLVGEEVVFGIRPEHIFDCNIKKDFPGGEALDAVVEVIEPIGAQLILLCSFDGIRLTASMDPHTKCKEDERMTLMVDMNQMQLFEKKSGETLYV